MKKHVKLILTALAVYIVLLLLIFLIPNRLFKNMPPAVTYRAHGRPFHKKISSTKFQTDSYRKVGCQ